MTTTLTVEEPTLKRFNRLKESVNSELPANRADLNTDALLHELMDEYEGVDVETLETKMREIAREEIDRVRGR